MSKVEKAKFQLKNDFQGYVFYLFKIISISVRKITSSNLVKIACLLNGAKLGKNVSFYGIPILDRRPLSKITIGNNCTFRSDSTTNLANKKKCIIRTYNAKAIIEIGNKVGMNGSVIAAANRITIGNDVLIGFNCYISDTDNHAIDPLLRHTGKAETAPILIEDNVWLGINVVVLKGVTIGKNSVIGANSLVLSNVPENVIAIGNPCRVIKKI